MRQQAHLRILILGDLRDVLFRHHGRDPDGARSAMVMIDWVGSLIIVPGATAEAVMLPLTGAVTVSSRPEGLASAAAPSVLRRASR